MDQAPDTSRRRAILAATSLVVIVIIGMGAFVYFKKQGQDANQSGAAKKASPEASVSQDADASVETISRTPVVEGTSVTYTVVYKVISTTVQNELIIEEQLEEGQEYVDGSASPHVATYDAASRTIRWKLKSVPVNYQGILTYQVKDTAAQKPITATDKSVAVTHKEPRKLVDKTERTVAVASRPSAKADVASPSGDTSNGVGSGPTSPEPSPENSAASNPSSGPVDETPTPQSSPVPSPSTIPNPSPTGRLDNPQPIARYAFVNVKSEGTNIKGDGVTDDTSAIQALIDSGTRSQTLYFPKGRYKITKPLRLPRTGSDSPYLGRQLTIIGQNRDQAIIDAIGLVGPMFTWADGTSAARTSFKAITLNNQSLKGTVMAWEANSQGRKPLVLSAMDVDMRFIGNTGPCDESPACMVAAVRLDGALSPYFLDVNIKGGSPLGGIGAPYSVGLYLKDSTGAYFKNLNFVSGISARAIWIEGGGDHTIRNSRLDAGSRRLGASYYLLNTKNIHLAHITGEGTDDNPFLKVTNSKQVYVKNIGAASNGRLARLSDLDDTVKYPKPAAAWFTNLVSIEDSEGVTIDGGNLDDQARYLRWWKMKHPDFVLADHQGHSLLVDNKSRHVTIKNVRIGASQDNQYDATTLVPSENVQIDSPPDADVSVALLDSNVGVYPGLANPTTPKFWGNYNVAGTVSGAAKQAWSFYDENGDKRIDLANDGYASFISRVKESTILTLKGAAAQQGEALIFQDKGAKKLGSIGSNGAVQIGSNGAEIKEQRTLTSTIDVPSIDSLAAVDVAVNLAGVEAGDQLVASPSTEPPIGLTWSAFVDSKDKAIVRVSNLTGSAIDLSSQEWRFTLWKH
jgi:hypothetical protein